LGGASLIRCCLGEPGWRQEADEAMALARGSDAITCVTVTTYKYLPVLFGAITINDDALCDTAEAVRIADQWGNDFTVGFARFTQGLVLINHAGTGSGLGFIVLEEVRESIKQGRLSMTTVPTIDMYLARAKARSGDLDGAIELSRSVVEDLYRSEAMLYRGAAVEVLVELLLRRGEIDDLREAGVAIDRLAAAPTDPGLVLNELPLLRLRALLARAHGNEAGYHTYAKDFAAMASSLGFQARMAQAAAMR
jgi:adenylate cyclase